MKQEIKNNKYIHRLLWIVFFMVLWETGVHMKIYPTQIFPSLIDIGRALVDGLIQGDLVKQIVLSLFILLKGFLISIVIAFFFCFIGYYNRVFQSLIDFLLVVLHPLPGIALLPLIILWVGIGEKAILVVMIHSILWPMIINIQTGFKNIDSMYIEVAKNNGINKIQLFLLVLIPLSVPNLLAGLKIGWSRGWRSLISAEMIFGAIGSVGGIGWYIFEKRVFMDTPGMYAGLLIMIIIGFIVEDFFFGKIDYWIEKKL